MTIGQLAARAGVGVETVRFYERRGLLPRPPRPIAGFREYPSDALARIAFIKRAKELGFSLKEIAELLSLRVHPRANCSTVKRRAEVKIADVQSKIGDLRKLKRTLDKLVAACERRSSTEECPILEVLASRS